MYTEYWRKRQDEIDLKNALYWQSTWVQNIHLQEDVAMDKKEVKAVESVKAVAQDLNIEAEIASEVAPLQTEINQLQQTINQLKSSQSQPSYSQSASNQQMNQLLQQVRNLKNQIQQQQQQGGVQQLQQSIQQAVQALNQCSQYIQTTQALGEMNSLLDEYQQQMVSGTTTQSH